MDIMVWLRGLGLGKYEAAFRENEIDETVLPSLTAEDLKELGVAALGHRRKLLDAIAALRTDASAKTPSVDAAFSSSTPCASPEDRAERRQVTVMFSDLVGSAALSARIDPEDFGEVVSVYQKCVAETVQRFGGFVAAYMGDGVLVYLGYPEAHEDDAEQAVRAGLEVVAAVRDLKTRAALQTRVGIATGLVVVGDLFGSGASEEQAIVGETPNLAARLLGIAEPNGVVIAESTRKLVGNLFELQDLGVQKLKGIVGPTRVWAALRPSSVESRFEALRAVTTPLVGRGEEIELLMRRWEQAKDGDGNVVLISGEPGIGKSRVAQTIVERLANEPHIRLRYFCSPHHQDSALYPSITQLERAAGFRREDTDKQRLSKLETVLAQATDNLGEVVPLMADLLSIPTGDRYPPLNLSPQKRKEKIFQAQLAQLEGLASRQPVLMVFEDIHWSDPTTRESLDLLIDRLPTLRVLVILTFRPEFAPPWIGRPQVTFISLNRLSPRQRAKIIAHVTGGKALPKQISDQIIDRTDGVPLFVEELTKTVVESGLVTETAAGYVATQPVASFAIPTSLHASLLARLDRLAPTRELAQIGAALGRSFSHQLISAVAKLPQQQVDDGLLQLVRAELIFQHGTPPEAEYSFKHALVQDAAYSTLLRGRRQQLHGLISATLEREFSDIVQTQPEVIARHCTEANLIEKAVGYWLKAGQLALSRMALPEAIAHLNFGLALIQKLDESPERDRLELQVRSALGTAWWARKGWMADEIVDALKPALKIAKGLGQPGAIIQVLWGLWVYYLIRGRVRQSVPLAEEALRVAQRADDEALLVARVMAEATHFWHGELKEALKQGDAILALYDERKHWHIADQFNHDPKTIVGIYGQHCLWILGYPDQALDIARRKDEHARRRNHPFDLGFALTQGAHIYDYLGDATALRVRAEEAERLGAERGLPTFEIMGRALQGVALVRAGQYDRAVPVLRAAIEQWHSTGARFWGRYIREVLAEALAYSDKIEQGLEVCDGVLDEIEQPESRERWHYAELLRLRGWMLSLKGDVCGSEQSYANSLEWARQQQAKSWELRAAMSLARLWRDQGKVRQARELLAPVYGWFTEGFDTRDLKEAKALLEELAA
jgi:class 3 adenylate cyclase/tetratricopeptide (TPR) repeat protein